MENVFIIPTERWIGPTINVPHMGAVTRETHVHAALMCRIDQSRYLTENFFAFYCDANGNRVADSSLAIVSSPSTAAAEVDLLEEEEPDRMFPDAAETNLDVPPPTEPTVENKPLDVPPVATKPADTTVEAKPAESKPVVKKEAAKAKTEEK